MCCREGERLSFNRTVSIVRNHYNVVVMTANFDALLVENSKKTAILDVVVVA